MLKLIMLLFLQKDSLVFHVYKNNLRRQERQQSIRSSDKQLGIELLAVPEKSRLIQYLNVKCSFTVRRNV